MGSGFSYKNKLYVLEEKDLYVILGVDENADPETISKEYRTIAKILHPDLHPDLPADEKEKLNQIFKKITAAFNLLKDPEARKNYDLEQKLFRAKRETTDKKIKPTEPPKQQPQPTKPPEPKKEPPKQQPQPTKPPEPKKEQPKGDLQSSSPIKNDPRLQNTLSGFSFKSINFEVDMDKLRVERVQKDKEHAKENFEKAKKLITEKNYDEAINILRFLTEKYGNIAVYHSYLGLAMEGKGWQGYAQAEFKVALHYDPLEPIAQKHYNYTPQTGQTKHETTDKDQGKGILGKFKSFFNKS